MKDLRTIKVEGSSDVYLVYPARVAIEKRKTVDEYILIYVNTLDKQPQFLKEIKEEYANEADIHEVYCRIRTDCTDYMVIKNLQIATRRPIISEGFNHALSIFSKDKNLLEFIKFEIDKKLKERNAIMALDKEFQQNDEIEIIEPAQKQTVPSLSEILEGNSRKPASRPTRPRRQRFIEEDTRSVSQIFDDMRRDIDDFFKKW